MTEESKIDRTVHRYTPLDAAAVIRDLIDGEDPNTDAMAGLMDPVRRLLLSVEDIRVRAHLALTRPMAQGELPMANDIFNCLMDLVGLQHSGHADEPEAPALTLDGLAAIIEANRDRIVVYTPATKCLDGCVSVSLNGACVQLTMEEETPASGDLMVGAFNATEAARDLIAAAQTDTDHINDPEAGGEKELDEMISHRLEDLHTETMGDASRIGDAAWRNYHAVKSEVERLQESPEEGGEA